MLALWNTQDNRGRGFENRGLSHALIETFAFQASAVMNNEVLVDQNKQLKELLGRARGGMMMVDHLTEQVRQEQSLDIGEDVEAPFIISSLKGAVNDFETTLIEQHLRANDWNQTRTAETLKIPRRTLIDKMTRYQIKPPLNKRRARHLAKVPSNEELV